MSFQDISHATIRKLTILYNARNPLKISSKVIIITGASDGIGKQLALDLSAPGVSLVLAARNITALEQVAEDCRARGAAANTIATDVSVQESCRQLISDTVSRYGAIDILINNAGVSMSTPFLSIEDLSIFERLMAVNYLGAVYCTHVALPHLIRRRGLVVAISSLQGKSGFPHSTGYSASKFAVQGFFESLRMEIADSGVDCLIVSPGPVATKIHSTRLMGNATPEEEAAMRQATSYMPVEICSAKIKRAIFRRDRELITHTAGRILPWMRLLVPKLTDRYLMRAVKRFYGRQ